MYEDLELWYPLLRLREAGAETFVVGTGSSEDVYQQVWLSGQGGLRPPTR